MDQTQVLQEFSTLSPEAQKLVADLIAFLSKQSQPSRSTKVKSRPLVEEKFIGLWQDRADMEDSHRYVRNFRQREWA